MSRLVSQPANVAVVVVDGDCESEQSIRSSEWRSAARSGSPCVLDAPASKPRIIPSPRPDDDRYRRPTPAPCRRLIERVRRRIDRELTEPMASGLAAWPGRPQSVATVVGVLMGAARSRSSSPATPFAINRWIETNERRTARF